MKKIAVILPAYNEEKTIAEVIKGFHQELPDAEIIVVNNNSRDKTASLAENSIQSIGANGKVITEPRQGKGNAVRCAFHAVEADIYVMSDADLTYPAEQVKELISIIERGEADMVVGDRLSGGDYGEENKRNFHQLGNNMVRVLVNSLFKANLKDIMSGYRAFNRRFVKNYPIMVEGFQIETDMTLHALDKKFVVKEIPVRYVDRPEGSVSKLNTFSDGARVLFTIFQILRYYRPMLFFGSVSAFFAFLTMIAGYPVITDWFQHKYIYHIPMAILASGLGLISVMSFSLGLVLDSITHQYRMKYEHDQLR